LARLNFSAIYTKGLNLKIKSERDFWAGLMFIVVGAAFAWGATNYSFGSSARPGPAYFPFGLGVLMSILGGAVLVKALVVDTEDGEKIGRWAWRPLLMISLTVAIFGWVLPLLGMFIALPILVVVAALAGDEFRWKEVIVLAVLLTLFSWVIFIWGLKLTIPLWPSFLTK
jgi:Tripartite tricarboxylate transporter TctB family